jgi:MoaA/NifB/PqqE/SkfB family radical SAM enzyme
MKITLSLTHRCDLSCTYCYSGRAVKKDMSLRLNVTTNGTLLTQSVLDFLRERTGRPLRKH